VDELHTDGNALGGVLQEIFAAEMTSAQRTCRSCRQTHAVGAHRLYASAGFVLRCPNCGDLAAIIATCPGEYRVTLVGTWSVARA
jgi:hypothetical protein